MAAENETPPDRYFISLSDWSPEQRQAILEDGSTPLQTTHMERDFMDSGYDDPTAQLRRPTSPLESPAQLRMVS